MLGKLDLLSHSVSKWFDAVGAVAIIVMMIVTCVDVFGAKVLRLPLPGAFDFIVISQLVSTAFAAAFVLVLNIHVKVDFLVTRLPRRTQAAISSIIHLLSLILFILIVWRLILYGLELQASRESSAEIRIPLYPFAYMIALASIPVCLVLLAKLLSSVKEVFER
jgi:TRAP-type C4-dicarboxylate transport system permease small subunit